MDNKLKEGETFFANGKMEEAEECFLSVIEKDTHNKVAYNNLGVVAIQKGDVKTAVEYYTKSLEIDHLYKDAIENYTDLIRTLNQSKEGEDVVKSHPFHSRMDEDRNMAIKIIEDERKQQWAQFKGQMENAHSEVLKGPILDLGSGRGAFVFSGLSQQYDVWGVDNREENVRFFKERVQLSEVPGNCEERCILADGQKMPFDSNYFTAIHSWYVLEHLENLEEILRETVRVTRRGGIIYLIAQDARAMYDGHYEIPWLPFMPWHLARIWVEEFGKPYTGQSFYYITLPQVASILEACGCKIIAQTPPPKTRIQQHWQIHTEQELRTVARKVRELLESKQWPALFQDLVIYAEKM